VPPLQRRQPPGKFLLLGYQAIDFFGVVGQNAYGIPIALGQGVLMQAHYCSIIDGNDSWPKPRSGGVHGGAGKGGGTMKRVLCCLFTVAYGDRGSMCVLQ
jgi:hypothetical protein